VDRSERIRTYNFPENRIADHRTGFKAFNLDQVLDGDLDPVIRSAIEADEAHQAVYLAWRCAQDLRAAYRCADLTAGRAMAEIYSGAEFTARIAAADPLEGPGVPVLAAAAAGSPPERAMLPLFCRCSTFFPSGSASGKRTMSLRPACSFSGTQMRWRLPITKRCGTWPEN